jgi:hypothetical protein
MVEIYLHSFIYLHGLVLNYFTFTLLYNLTHLLRARSNPWVVGTNPTPGKDVCVVYLLCLGAVLCVGSVDTKD